MRSHPEYVAIALENKLKKLREFVQVPVGHFAFIWPDAKLKRLNLPRR
jgi:hypothetical protein